MRASPLLRSCLAGAALALAGMTAPALAGENHGHEGSDGPPPEWYDRGPPGAYDFMRAREDWLAECRRRMPPSSHGSGPDGCAAFLDDFYARRAPSYGYPAQGYTFGGPTVMVPVMQSSQADPECTETVEYVYDDVPARRQLQRAPRRAPDKRIRLVPDKRSRIN